MCSVFPSLLLLQLYQILRAALNRAHHNDEFSCLCKSIISTSNVVLCVFTDLGLPGFEITGSFSTKRWSPYTSILKHGVEESVGFFCHRSSAPCTLISLGMQLMMLSSAEVSAAFYCFFCSSFLLSLFSLFYEVSSTDSSAPTEKIMPSGRATQG